LAQFNEGKCGAKKNSCVVSKWGEKKGQSGDKSNGQGETARLSWVTPKKKRDVLACLGGRSILGKKKQKTKKKTPQTTKTLLGRGVSA